jgi:hypothetical protein
VEVTMKVLEALAAAIAAEGIDRIFAVIGDANQDIIVELCEKHGLKFVHTHHETAAVGWRTAMRAFPARLALRPPRKVLATPTQRPRWFQRACIDRRS